MPFRHPPPSPLSSSSSPPLFPKKQPELTNYFCKIVPRYSTVSWHSYRQQREVGRTFFLFLIFFLKSTAFSNPQVWCLRTLIFLSKNTSRSNSQRLKFKNVEKLYRDRKLRVGRKSLQILNFLLFPLILFNSSFSWILIVLLL